MPFDQPTRNRLQRFVADARGLLTKEFTRQFQNDYGLDSTSGTVAPLESLAHLDDGRRETGRILRATLEHYLAGSPGSRVQDVLERIVREQAFTVLNRLAALRMAEARGYLIESIAAGYQSRGFQLFAMLAGAGLGETGEAYRAYLFSLFDEFACDLRSLFDRFSPLGRLFPREAVLLDLLKLINEPEIAKLWAEDETIGWMYQYFNSKEERKQMRDDSAAPRNSRELAVRNQFFTPRYVVEFLTDNTLGRVWYEMTKGQTALVESCRYQVRYQTEIFLGPGVDAPVVATEENLSKAELLKLPVYVLHRALKDPREIRMIDPACGSMHFGLYAFDLYERIYQEAWELEQQECRFERAKGPKSLHETYESEEAFHRDIPRLIIEHNIHGIDIDARAVQIAGLSLWLRAQKSWQAQGLKPQARPMIQKSNIVCAEPMPGEERLLDEFIQLHFASTPEQSLIGQLLRRVFAAMKLAGEAGSLLQIEQEISQDIETARQQWLNRPKDMQLGLWATDEQPQQQELSLSVDEITDERFLEGVETEIYKALNQYAEQAGNDSSFQRRLFANDAVRGFAFIDICRKKFDVALMNPPFGEASKPSQPYIDVTYGDTKGDVYKTFVECFQSRLISSGMLGIISSRSGFFLAMSADWRERILLRLYRPLLLVDLGSGVLDAMVETAAYVLRTINEKEEENLVLSVLPELKTIKLDRERSFNVPTYQKHRGGIKRYHATQELSALQKDGFVSDIAGDYTRFSLGWNGIKQAQDPQTILYPLFICFRLIESANKEDELLKALSVEVHPARFISSPLNFQHIPGSSFAYWMSEYTRLAFLKFPVLGTLNRAAKHGIATADDFRFLRLSWEVANEDLCLPSSHATPVQGSYCVLKYKWFFLPKGGSYSLFYADVHLLANWSRDGCEMKAWTASLGDGSHHWSRKITNSNYYFRPGLTWPRRTNGLGFRVMPRGCIFADKGPAIFVDEDSSHDLLALSGVVNSAVFSSLVALQLARTELAQSFEVGIIHKTPVPDLSSDATNTLASCALHAWSLKRSLDTTTQISHAFSLPALLQAQGTTLATRSQGWAAKTAGVERELTQIQTEIDDFVFDLYGIDKSERSTMNFNTVETSEPTDEDEEDSEGSADLPSLTSELVAYIFGVAMGRFDVRLATGERPTPVEPEPFDPLPVCSPGMLVADHGLPPVSAEEMPPGYPIAVPFDGVLVDDEGHSRDVVRALCHVLGVIWADGAEVIEQEICTILGIRSLREYLRKPAAFFADHLTRYSRSRRQAPLFWPLSTRSGGYTLWIYYHRLNDQTLYTCVNDYIEPKLRSVREAADRLRGQSSRSRDEQKQFEELQELELELPDLRDEILRIAQLPWRPNLNDGVQITAAPLWKLFRLPRWQKKLKETWESLEKGEYDWAHLAYTIWPERVREKCRKDKSLAIAHELEDLYEEPPPKPAARGRKKSGS